MAGLVPAACADVVRVEDEGVVCLAPEDPVTLDELALPVAIEAGERLRVAVYSSCVSPEASGACELTQPGPGQLRLEATFEYEDEIYFPCYRYRATCETDGPVSAGSYVLRFGDAEAELQVPAELPGACVIGDLGG